MSTTARSFYVSGGTLGQDAPSYIERQADTDLYAALRQGEFCYVLTSRQMGKSSLMVRTAARLREAGVAVAVLDLTAIGQHLSVEQWYDGLLRHVGLCLNLEEELEEFWFSHERLSPLQRWIAALTEVVLLAVARRQMADESLTKPIPSTEHRPPPTAYRLPSASAKLVIFVDEIDAVQSLPFAADEFFAAIRELYNRRTQDPELQRLTFCLLGVATPTNLIQDSRTTPFNVGRRIELTDFTAAEAAPLARGLVGEPLWTALPRRARGSRPARSGDPLVFDDGYSPHHEEPVGLDAARRLLERVLYWTAGHPYLTQRLCRAVAETYAANPKSRNGNPKSEVDRLCDTLFLSPGARETDDNLLFVRDRLLRSETDLAGLLELYQQVWTGKRVGADVSNQLVEILCLSGIVRQVGGHLRVRNRIYERVFDRTWAVRHMPNAELRRQRAAFRRGLARASATALGVVTVTAGLAGAAIHQWRRADANAQRAARNASRAVENAAAARQQALRANRGEQQALAATVMARKSAQQAQDEKWAAVQAEQRAQWLAAERQSALEGRETALRKTIAAETKARDEATAGKHLRYTVDMNLAPREWENNNIEMLRRLLADTEDNRDRGFEWAYWQRLCHLSRRTLRGHLGAVTSVAFSRDGRRLVTGSDDGTAIVWDTATGREIFTLRGHAGPINAVAFGPNGRWIATGSDDRVARLWDAATGRPRITLIGHTGAVSSVAFSPDGRWIVSGSEDKTARVWDAGPANGPAAAHLRRRELLTLRGHASRINAVAVSPDGRWIVTGSQDRSTKLWDAGSGRQIRSLSGHTRTVTCVAFSPDGHLVAVGSLDDRAIIWDTATGLIIRVLHGVSGSVNAIAFSPDGQRIVTGITPGRAQVWDLSGNELFSLRGHTDSVRAVAFSQDGRQIATGSVDQTARIWAPDSDQVALTLRGHSNSVLCSAFSRDGTRVVTGSEDQTAKVWDATTGRVVCTLRGHTGAVWAVGFSPDGRRLVTGATQGDLIARVWDARTGRQAMALRGHLQGVPTASFSPDGRTILTGSFDRTFRLWDADTDRMLRIFGGHTGGVLCAAFSRDGRRIATCSGDRTAAVWDAATGREVSRMDGRLCGFRSVAFSPDGGRIVTGNDDRTARVWDALTGRPLLILKGHTSIVYRAVYSPDGSRIVTGSDDHTAKVWNATTGSETLTLNGHADDVRSVDFSPDGRRILTGSDDGTAKLWDAAPPLQIAEWHAEERADDQRLAAARRRAEEERRRLTARAARHTALQVVASSTGGGMRLQWRPQPGAVAYQLYRSAQASLSRAAGAHPGTGDRQSRFVRLTPRPLTRTSFIDHNPDLASGHPVTYVISPLYKRSALGPSRNEGPPGIRQAELDRQLAGTSGLTAAGWVPVQAIPIAAPPEWTGTSINEGEHAGSVIYRSAAREIVLRGSGADLWGSADGCYFLSRPITGDFRITVKLLAGPAAFDPAAKAGLMVRDSLSADARNASLIVQTAHLVSYQWRGATHYTTASLIRSESRGEALPITLRLTRQGGMILAEYRGADSQSFQPMEAPLTFRPPLAKTLLVGLVISSHDAGQISEATFSGLNIERR